MLENGTSGAGVPPDRARFDGTAAAARERSWELREQLNASRARFTRLWWSSHAESDQPDASSTPASSDPSGWSRNRQAAFRNTSDRRTLHDVAPARRPAPRP
jgi:hypothetical protein